MNIGLRFVLVPIFLFICQLSAQQHAYSAPGKRVVRQPGGWTVPGVRRIEGIQPNRRTIQLEGVSAEKENFPLRPATKSVHPGEILELVSEGQNEIVLRKREYVADDLTGFSVSGKVFCYKVRLHPYDYDDKSKVGGAVAGQFDLAFYDFDGDGIFETLEPVDPILGDHPGWVPEVPDWAKGLRGAGPP